ncbi:MAG: ATP-binding protein [Candidatus Methanoperedens sp.]|nr:ATP-binding protein [Candidatus Methanoperedens sp.]
MKERKMTHDQKSSGSEGTLPIKVNAEVVSHLSFGLYRNFARAVKELISNSYDAGATEVKIKLDLDNELIIVRDNGKGMNLKEIEDKFLHIARRTPLTEDVDEFGRKRIGSFGIGFLSTFPYCKELQLITKKAGTSEIIEVRINTEQFFNKDSFKITDVKVPYKMGKSDIPIKKGETIIILNKIAPHIIKELTEETHDKYSIDKIGGYQRFKWTLAQYAPLQYPPEKKELKTFFDEPNKLPMRLWLNAEEIFRNVPENAIILETGKETFGNVALKYAIMTPKEPVKPKEAKGLQIRLRDVAIGFPTDFDVIKATGKVPGKLNYLCGEVYILSGLESAVMIDRDNFSYTEDVAQLQVFFRNKLA